MIRRIVLGAGAALLTSASGCGSAGPVTTDTPAEIPDSNAPPAPVAYAPAGPDDRPELLLGYGRWRDPDKTVREVLTFLGEKDDWRSLLKKELGEDADKIDVLALNASFDFAFSLDARSNLDDPDVLFAVSIPIADFDAALAMANEKGSVAQSRPGVYRIDLDGEPCDLWPTSGDAPGRMICGPGKRDVSVLGPWLAQGLPQVPPDPAAMSMHLELAPFKAHFLPELRTLVEEGKAAGAEMMREELGTRDPVLVAAPGVVLDEALAFAEDWQGLRLFADLDGGSRTASFGGTMQFGSNRSWFTQVLTETGGQPGPPSVFWRAPKDSDSVQFGHSSDPKHYRGIRTVAHKLVKLGLAQSPLSPADQKAIVQFIDDIPVSSGAWAYAQGSLPFAPSPKGKPTPASAVKSMQDMIRGYVGWSIVGVDDPSGAYVKWLASGHDVYGRLEAFARPMLSTLDPAASKLIPQVRFSRTPAGFPRGSATLDVEFRFDSEIAWEFANLDAADAPPHPPGPKAQGRMTVTAVVVPDGPDRTWIGISADRKTLRKKIEVALSGAPDSATIASRNDLGPLRKSAAPFGGYYTWGNSVKNTLKWLPEAPKNDVTESLEKAFAAMPNGGQTPILVVGSAKPGAEYGLAVHVQKGTFDDIAAAFGVVDLESLGKMLDELDEVDEVDEESPEFQF